MSRNVTPNGNGLGWKPDIPDHRDHIYAAPPERLNTLPAKVDLRDQCPPVYQQGQLGSCTANAIAGAIEFDQKKQGLKEFTPSRLMIYYDERVMEGSVDSDAGAMIRDGIKSVAIQGACPEDEWPYDISKFTEKPPAKCYTDAVKYKALSYKRVVRNLDQFKGCLSAGYPFVLGISVYESFESAEVARSGKVPMPKRGEQLLGGHAILCVGYDDALQSFIFRNSWGDWAEGGYFYLYYQYLLNTHLSSDFWTVRTVSG